MNSVEHGGYYGEDGAAVALVLLDVGAAKHIFDHHIEIWLFEVPTGPLDGISQE